MSDERKPCPFCGGASSGGETSDGGRFIECVKCGASTSLRYTCGDEPWPLLVEAWNRRASSALENIGLQAIEVRRARKVWLDVKRKHNAALAEYSSETGNAYIGGKHGEPDQEIDESYGDRRRAAKESVKQAAKLRSMIARHEANHV